MKPGADTATDRPRHDDVSVLETLGGGEVIEADPRGGRVSLRFEVRPEFCHPGGAQGGFVAGWMDSAMAHAVMVRTEHAQVPATLEVKVSFLRPVFAGQTVTARAEIVRMGRSMVFLEARLYGADEELLATASSTGKLVPAGGIEPGKVR